jgi:hypothetical protein
MQRSSMFGDEEIIFEVSEAAVAAALLIAGAALLASELGLV